jgi:hypothetical protein
MDSKLKTQNFKLAVIAGALFLALAANAVAQQQKSIPRIAYLTVASLSANADRIEAFRQ